MTFGQTIRHARMERLWKQQDVARRLCISKQYLSDLENDRRSPPMVGMIPALADLLEIPSDVLYYRVGRLPPDR